MYRFGKRSIDNLQGVDARLVYLMSVAIATTTIDFTVIEGLRTKKRQKELYKAGHSKTMNSKHLKGLAVDIMPYPTAFESPIHIWEKLIDHIEYTADKLKINIKCGRDFPTLVDYPHIELRA